MNKKTLVIMTLLLLFIVFMIFGAAGEDSGQIVFKGFIVGDIYFNVETTNKDSVNLLSDEMMPGTRGVEIGKWNLRIDNPPVEYTSFVIQYDYNPLKSTNSSITDEIEYVLLEKDENGDSFNLTERHSGNEIVIISNLGTGSTYMIKTISAVLTEAGRASAMKAAATDTYRSNITISLSAD